MRKDSKIFVAGHSGMVGSAILRCLRQQGYENIITRSHADLALDVQKNTDDFFASNAIEYVFLAAARVGGIMANVRYGGDFIRDNLRIQTNVIDAAYRNGVQKLLFLGSSCIYPKEADQPIQEASLLTGALEQTNLPYAVAKIAGSTMCDAYCGQFGFDAFTAMPSNVYGIGDNFHPDNAHLVAGMMRRFHEAKVNDDTEVVVWGSGKPMRELVFADDLADACVFLMKNYDAGGLVNVGSGHEYSVSDLAQQIKSVTGFKGDLVYDLSKPDGTMRKIMDNSKLSHMGWHAPTPLQDGLHQMYGWFLENVANTGRWV